MANIEGGNAEISTCPNFASSKYCEFLEIEKEKKIETSHMRDMSQFARIL